MSSSRSSSATQVVAPEDEKSRSNSPLPTSNQTTSRQPQTTMANSHSNTDLESQKPEKIPFFRQIFNQSVLTDAIIKHHYDGQGTEESPFVVKWIPDDPRNPMLFSETKKWAITIMVAFATLAVAFCSSAYSGGVKQIIATFHTSQEIVTLGISLFVLGFALGPLLWAPLSELYGRQYLFIFSYACFTAFNGGAIAAQNVQTLILMRFFAGTFGSSPLTNAGGVIADMFPASHRGLAMAIFAAAPFMGPVLGPIAGGFLGEAAGWRWVEAMMTIFTGVMTIMLLLFVPETYAPLLLRKRAAALSKLTGKVYRSELEAKDGAVDIRKAFKTALSRPWILLFREPIVLIISVYMAIIYGTLYMLFGAFPIVYQEYRGWSEGVGGLAFLGIAVGMILAVLWCIYHENPRYQRVQEQNDGFAPPEARLFTALIGSVAIPIGFFWFAWTNSPSIHWSVSIIASTPFGFGIVLVFLSCMNYLIDSYTIFAASVLAANSVLRSLFGAAFPLFTTQMYDRLGIHWASSIPAFLALACVPFPFLFYKYGAPIRQKCKYAAISDKFMRKAMADLQQSNDNNSGKDSQEEASASHEGSEKQTEKEFERNQDSEDRRIENYNEEQDRRVKITKISRGDDPRRLALRNTLSRQHTHETLNPFDIDRVNTNESFPGERSRDKRPGTGRSTSRR